MTGWECEEGWIDHKIMVPFNYREPVRKNHCRKVTIRYGLSLLPLIPTVMSVSLPWPWNGLSSEVKCYEQPVRSKSETGSVQSTLNPIVEGGTGFIPDLSVGKTVLQRLSKYAEADLIMLLPVVSVQTRWWNSEFRAWRSVQDETYWTYTIICITSNDAYCPWASVTQAWQSWILL